MELLRTHFGAPDDCKYFTWHFKLTNKLIYSELNSNNDVRVQSAGKENPKNWIDRYMYGVTGQQIYFPMENYEVLPS